MLLSLFLALLKLKARARPILLAATVVAGIGATWLFTTVDGTSSFPRAIDAAVADSPIDTPPDTPPDTPTDSPEAREWIVVAGQSNALGTGISSTIDPAIAASYPSVRLVSAGSMVSFVLTVGHDGALQPRADGKFGVELTLGRALPQYDIIQVGIDGTSLWYNWKPTGNWPGADNLYEQMVTLVHSKIGSESVAAFVWIQGESDAGNTTWAAAYETNLEDLATRVRAEFGNPIFVYNRLHNSTSFTFKSTVRAGQESADANTDYYMVNVDDLGISGYHFTSQGLLDFGNRLATTIDAAIP